MPRAVVADGDIDFARLVEGPQHDRGLGRLAGGLPLLRRLDAMIDGIPHQVRERIADGLDDRLVEFHFRPFDLQFALLAQLGAQIANDARKAVEHRAHDLHAGLHDRLVQVGGHLIDAGRYGLELGLVFRAERLQQLIAREDQFPGQGHQLVEHAHADADARVGRGACARASPRDGRLRLSP